ncbi:Bax inhibitor-1 family protein [Ureibacillus acetophenoni]|uniref:Uncharacterized protein n=1 Tax=Ureibacillus acetophenoni TaxID=614649 RepID=A0A285UKP9_9BACL|nr:Bax inhibitor-1 family protein [Ureibacillus acetophenoni]SOC42343.1 hypothetical protein SAMN05877842_11240 [Ureibacillus acetophenoni]
MLFETLFSKVFFILSIQLIVTTVACVGLIQYIRYLYNVKKVHWISATYIEKGKVDLHIDFRAISKYFWMLFILNIVVFIVLLFIQHQLGFAMILFTIWSILTGFQVALALISVDENLGTKVLAITASVTFITALIGLYSGIDFSFLGKFLLIALIILVVINVIRIFINIKGTMRKLITIFGVALFTLYLIFDFNRITRADNNWHEAMNIAINIYLDIINLFLYLLDLLSAFSK